MGQRHGSHAATPVTGCSNPGQGNVIVLGSPTSSEEDPIASQVLDSVDRFIAKQLAPRAAEIDATDSYPWDLHREAAELGLFAIALPETYGGLGLDLRTRLKVLERVARCSGSFAVILSAWPDAVQPIIQHGTSALREEVLPKVATGEWCPAISISEPSAGSDAAAMTTIAERTDGGYLLSGTKAWCTHGGMADIVVVFAKTDPDAGHRGITAFLVRKGAKGFRAVRDEKLTSLKGSPQSALEFEKVFVPEAERLGPEGAGFKMAMAALDEARLNVSAKALGAAYTCIRIAVDYARDRRAFGQPIIEHQGLQFLLSDLVTEYTAAKAVWEQAIDAYLLDGSRRAGVVGSMAKNLCTDIAMKASVEAMQVLGATGLSMDVPLERFMRDVKAYQIYDGTTQIHKMIIGRYLQREGLPFE
jgi:alkylation response protein AidB-like acyl-CoA dehydrogenase